MHPALSVIFFTTASGAGYGLLTLMGVGYLHQVIPEDSEFALTGIIAALLLISAGLVSSTFHLGHPERAWRALSQWRSSWLSREGVLALVTYIPVLVFAGGWFFSARHGVFFSSVTLLMIIFCLVTVYATSMIYASLRTIQAWYNHWVPLTYLSLALMTGAILLNALLLVFSHPVALVTHATLFFLVLGLLVKLAYWRYTAQTHSPSNAESAIGLGNLGRVELVQSPHSQDNYLLKEMGFRIARKHANSLRRICISAGFIIPFMLTLMTFSSSILQSAIASLLAVTSCMVGVIVERWLFFAEAKHTVMLYYGSSRV